MKLLLAEDDPHIGAGIVKGLRLSGFTVDWVRDGQEAILALAVGPYDLLVLDLGLPKLDGIELLDALRRKGHTIPILIVTARGAVADRVSLLNRGADDYLIKPFSLDELTARVHALLRRVRTRGTRELRLGRLCVVPETCTVTIDERQVNLTSREYALLLALMENPGNVVSLRDIEERIYGWNEEVASNAVEVLLHRLRRKLGGNWIRNVRGIGYKVAESD